MTITLMIFGVLKMYDSLKDKQVDDGIAENEEKASGAFLDESFINQMRYELRANIEKGNWQEWKPSYDEYCKELDHHVMKLKHAINYTDYEAIVEHSADVANIAEKGFTTFKKPKWQE